MDAFLFIVFKKLNLILKKRKKDYLCYIIYYKIIWIVRAIWLVHKCGFIALWSKKNEMSNMVCSLSKLWEFTVSWKKLKYTCIPRFVYRYIVFLFVKTENNIFIKEIKRVLRAIIAWWKARKSVRFLSDLLSNSPKHSPRFSPGYEGTRTIFIS